MKNMNEELWFPVYNEVKSKLSSDVYRTVGEETQTNVDERLPVIHLDFEGYRVSYQPSANYFNASNNIIAFLDIFLKR